MDIPGWEKLVVCTGAAGNDPCGFDDLLELVRALIQDMVVISTLLVVAVFIFAGFRLLTAGGDPGAFKEVRKTFTNVIIGYLWILAAWVIVYTITSVLLESGYSLLGTPTTN